MKGILKNLHRYVLWALISLVFWAWIISRITDAPAARKVTLYADLPALDRQALSEALEKDLPAGIRFVEAWAFTDEMFSPGNVTMGDLFVVSGRQAETYLPSFAPIDESAFPGGTFYTFEGKTYGVCLFDEAAGIRIGTRYLAFQPGEKYYLFFGEKSKHLGAWNGSGDDAAVPVARTLLTLP